MARPVSLFLYKPHFHSDQNTTILSCKVSLYHSGMCLTMKVSFGGKVCFGFSPKDVCFVSLVSLEQTPLSTIKEFLTNRHRFGRYLCQGTETLSSPLSITWHKVIGHLSSGIPGHGPGKEMLID